MQSSSTQMVHPVAVKRTGISTVADAFSWLVIFYDICVGVVLFYILLVGLISPSITGLKYMLHMHGHYDC